MNGRLRAIISRLNFKTLRRRFLAAMLLVSLPPLFILGYISFNIAKDTLMETNTRVFEDHLETSSEVADMLFRNLLTLNRSLVVNEEIRQALVSSNSKELSSRMDLSATAANRLQRAIGNNQFDTLYVNSICLMNNDFTTICSGRSDDAGIYERLDKKELIEHSDWYRKANEAQGRVIFFGSDVFGQNDAVFSTVKLFRDAATPSGEPNGLLIMNVTKSMFSDIFNETNSLGGFIALEETPSGINRVFTNERSTAPIPTAGGLDNAIAGLEKEGYLVSRYPNLTTDWTFLHVVKSDELLRQSNKIRGATTLIAGSMALLAFLIAIAVSASITRPLIRIKKMMVDWTQGVRSFNESFDQDEVGTIGETFKRMVTENQALSERLVHSELKEREAELRALQAQIKPHFLYNTLDSIYWMATLQNNHDVAQMAVSLSESFKLSLNKGRELIPVYKELKHIEHYLTIQNIRYNGRFQYIEEIEPAIMGMEIMKLLLQPLVENAIYHGLEPKVGPGTIRLAGRREGDFLIFTVEDDGVGIENKEVVEQGYGLKNVRDRMELYYGESSSFGITSQVGVGTRIELRFNPTAREEI